MQLIALFSSSSHNFFKFRIVTQKNHQLLHTALEDISLEQGNEQTLNMLDITLKVTENQTASTADYSTHKTTACHSDHFPSWEIQHKKRVSTLLISSLMFSKSHEKKKNYFTQLKQENALKHRQQLAYLLEFCRAFPSC